MSEAIKTVRVDDQDGIPVLGLQLPEIRSDSQVARVERELKDYLAENPAEKLVLDLNSVHFIGSSGLRVLLFLRKHFQESGGQFRICRVHPHVAEVFKTTRIFGQGFRFFEDIDSAVADLNGL